jgi:dTDP-4-dehydrorhamnose reductase
LNKVLVLGANGMLGKMCSLVFSDDSDIKLWGTHRGKENKFIFNSTNMELLNFDVFATEIEALIDKVNPDYVVNCIGRIKPTINEEDALSVSEAQKVNSELPIKLELLSGDNDFKIIQIGTDCVFSGLKGSYKVNDKYDALDIYGKTKAAGEIDNKQKMLIRTSIVGPEVKPGRSLLNWFLEQEEDARVNGFTNHLWNGITTLAFARVVKSVIINNSYEDRIFHLTPKDTISKFDLLTLFKESFKRQDILIEPVEAEEIIDRTLVYESDKENKKIWETAGYKDVPTLKELIVELATSPYSQKILEHANE